MKDLEYNKRGDHILQVFVIMPDKIDKEIKQMMQMWQAAEQQS